MLQKLDGLSITRFHDLMLIQKNNFDSDEPSGLWHWMEANHYYNTMLWNEEDKARRTDVAASEIAGSKRLIDQYNQKRNDAVEAIDETILADLQKVALKPHARLNSETAGAMIDRLFLLALKIFHMHQQTERTNASDAHIETCRGKHQRLITQRGDLAYCLDRLLYEAAAGDAYFKVYRQFKMYNDPTLNPYLYQQSHSAEV